MATAQAIPKKEERGSRPKVRRYVTVTEASKITGISAGTLKSHIEEGILSAEWVEKSRRYFIDLLKLKEYAFNLYENIGGVKMYDPFICFDANKDFYLYSKYKGM